MLQYSDDELAGKRGYDLIHPDDCNYYSAAHQECKLTSLLSSQPHPGYIQLLDHTQQNTAFFLAWFICLASAIRNVLNKFDWDRPRRL